MKAPWIGPNSWVANIERSRYSHSDIWNVPKHVAALRLSIIFNDGGAYDFYNNFRSAKERVLQAAEVRSMTADRNREAFHSSMNPGSIYLEQLPAYEDSPNSTSRNDDASMPCRIGQDIVTNGADLGPNEPSENSQPYLEPRQSDANTSQREQTAELPPTYEEIEQRTAVSARVSI